MFLLCQPVLEVLKFIINQSSNYGVIPYVWDKERNCLKMGRNTFYCWNFIKYLYPAHQAFMTYRLWKVLISRSGQSTSYTYYLLVTTYYVAYSVGTMVQTLLIHRHNEFFHFTNRMLQFLKDTEGKTLVSDHKLILKQSRSNLAFKIFSI